MEKITNWQDRGYLLSQTVFEWSELALKATEGNDDATIELWRKLKPLSANILRKKSYALFWEYVTAPELGNVENLVRQEFFLTLFLLHSHVCHGHQDQLLIGVDEDTPLWVELPKMVAPVNNTVNIYEWLYVGCLTLNFVGLFSGANPQQIYDRLFIPAPDRWPSKEFWAEPSSKQIENKIATVLDHNNGLLDIEYFEQILTKAELNRHFTLRPGRPVLVRFQNHAAIHQMILMQKQDTVIAKIETKQGIDLLEFVVLNNAGWGGMTQSIKSMFLGQPNSIQNYAIPALIAQIYHDLVTIETLEGTQSLNSSAKTKSNSKQSVEANRVTWQYIPRREYIKMVGMKWSIGRY